MSEYDDDDRLSEFRDPTLIGELLEDQELADIAADPVFRSDADLRAYIQRREQKLAASVQGREFIRGAEGRWFCKTKLPSGELADHPIDIDLHTLGIATLANVTTPVHVKVREDEEDSLYVTIEHQQITEVKILSKGLDIPLKQFVIPDDSFAAKYFLTGTATERAQKALEARQDFDPDLALGYYPLAHELDDDDDTEPPLI